jgi:hypothetical protein
MVTRDHSPDAVANVHTAANLDELGGNVDQPEVEAPSPPKAAETEARQEKPAEAEHEPARGGMSSENAGALVGKPPAKKAGGKSGA